MLRLNAPSRRRLMLTIIREKFSLRTIFEFRNNLRHRNDMVAAFPFALNVQSLYCRLHSEQFTVRKFKKEKSKNLHECVPKGDSKWR